MTRRLTAILTFGCAIAAVLAFTAGMIPYDWLRPLGGAIRRPDDVTPERYARYLQLGWGFGIAFGGLAFWMHRRRTDVARFLRDLFITEHGTIEQNVAPMGRSERLLLAGVLAVSAGLRLSQLDGPMAYDESYTWINFASRPWYEAIGDYNSTNNHLLNTLLVHLCGRLFGPQEWALRLPVFLLGCAFPLAVWCWARRWRGAEVALLTAALTAVSPALITYSTDARGYLYVAVAAIVLDDALARLRRQSTARLWMTAAAALVGGLCAMPIMAYAAIGSLGWFLLTPDRAALGEDCGATGGIAPRLKSATTLCTLSALATVLFYSPAYLFRGLKFLHDPILQSAPTENFPAQLAGSTLAAGAWWIDGAFPPFVWISLAVAGALFGMRSAWGWLRWLAPFGVVLGLNILQHVAPPPRIELHLAPWFYLLCSAGAVVGWKLLAGRLSSRPASSAPRAAPFLPALVLCLGAWDFAERPLPFFAEDRLSYQSIPDVIKRLQQEARMHPDETQILFAPLPCDLPSIFYMDRLGFRLPVNARPAAGDRVWLMSRPGESIRDVLGSGLIQCEDLADRFSPWTVSVTFPTLTLSTAVLLDAPSPTSAPHD